MNLRVILVAALVTVAIHPVAADPAPKALPPVVGNVTKIEKAGDAVHVTVARGTNDQVNKTSTCVFLDASDKVVSTDCTVIRIDKKLTVCKTKLALETVKSYARVRLTSTSDE